MTTVRMFVQKFGREVVIDEDHPLAVAQRARNAAAPADTPAGPVPAAPDVPAPGALRDAPPPRKRGRR